LQSLWALMSIYHKVQAVEKVFNSLEKELASFKNATDLKCLSGCGSCCHNPEINATPIEFLPFAYDLYKKGIAYEWLENSEKETLNLCRIFRPFLTDGDVGFCGHYKFRGLICRLFAFSASTDKMGQPKLATCKTIKTNFPEEHSKAVEHINSGGKVPIMSDYYHQIRSIDPDLGRQLLPINEAINEALKVVLSYYAYRRPRKAS
jgi:Fe-S-cluster containining protein